MVTAMTLTTPPPVVATVAPPLDRPAPAGAGGSWAIWGVVAGLAGAVATMFTDPQAAVWEDGVTLGTEAVRQVERAPYQIGVCVGFLAVVAVLFTASGWRRWAAERAPRNLAGGVVSAALTASAGAMMLGYGFKGAMAVYLPGGMDEGTFTDEGLFSLWMFLDFAPYIAWWGAAVAAVVVVWLSLRDRLLPRWVGLVSVPFALAPLVFMGATRLPGFPGVVGSAWLAIVSAGLAVSGRRARAR
jgi:hypothetical protein